MTTQTATPISHAEKEAAAYNAFCSARDRGDWAEAGRLWQRFTEIHKERPAAVVRAMEEAKGLV